MEWPRNLRQASDCIIALHKRLEEIEGERTELVKRMKALEHAQNKGLHADRARPPKQPFPQSLVEIGLHPPRRRTNAA